MDKPKINFELIIQTKEDVRYFKDELVAFATGNVGESRKGEALAHEFIIRYDNKIPLHDLNDTYDREYTYAGVETTKGLYRAQDILFTEESYDEALIQFKDHYHKQAVNYIESLKSIASMEKNPFRRRGLNKEIEKKERNLKHIRDDFDYVPKFPANDRIVLKIINYNEEDLNLIKERTLLFAAKRKNITILNFMLRKIETTVEFI